MVDTNYSEVVLHAWNSFPFDGTMMGLLDGLAAYIVDLRK